MLPPMRAPAQLARAIYGNVLATSLVVAFSEDNDYSTTEIAVSVLVTGLVFWIAHVYASLIAGRYTAGRRLTRAEVGAEFYGVDLAIAGGVAALVLWSLAIGRQERMSPLALAVMTLLNALFGVAVVLLKVIVH
jgi:hypothetical protein